MTSFLSNSKKRFTEYKSLAEKAMDQLEEKDFHNNPSAESNSIAIIIQHMHGNMISRWTNFLTEDGEKDWRKRDEEFEELPLSRQEIMNRWNEGWRVLMDTLESLKEEDLEKTITIRSQPLSVQDAILRQLAHYSYHVGQIVFLARWIKGPGWHSLSIPKGESNVYNQQLNQKRPENTPLDPR
jgi:uncharacterized damage-inducible protein DinB